MPAPRLLLVTDCSPSTEATGISRTIKNLFANYPPDRLLVATSAAATAEYPPAAEWKARVVTWRSSTIPKPLARLLGRFGQRLNWALRAAIPWAARRIVRRFAPEVIMLCGNTIECLIVARQMTQASSAPLIVYVMDDWQDLEDRRWIGGSARVVVTDLMQRAAGWIGVSAKLLETLAARYQIQPPKTLVAHNPVDSASFPAIPPNGALPWRLAYAGSIWQMHADALIALARGVAILRDEGVPIELALYTEERFWNAFVEEFTTTGARYGGFTAYADLPQTLSEANLLIVVSSFQPEYRHLAEGSVQTKLTDYMATGRPILACGPPTAACNLFVQHWSCGLCVETADPRQIADRLRTILADRAALDDLGRTGRRAAFEHFDMQHVQKQLYSFIDDARA